MFCLVFYLYNKHNIFTEQQRGRYGYQQEPESWFPAPLSSESRYKRYFKECGCTPIERFLRSYHPETVIEFSFLFFLNF